MSGRLVLALETSGVRGGLALGREDTLLAEREFSGDRRQSAELAPFIRELTAAAGIRVSDVQLVCFSAGPGSFTGLRIAATTCAMLHSATGCRVVRVPTLEVLARNALVGSPLPAGTRIVPMISVRRDEVAAAVFEIMSVPQGSGLAKLREASPGALWRPEALLRQVDRPIAVLGEGVRSCHSLCEAAGAPILPEELWFPRAREVLKTGLGLAAAGHYCAAEEIVPIYARPPECEEVYEQRRAQAVKRRERWPAD